MKKFSKIMAAVVAALILVMSIAGCSFVKDMDEVNQVREGKIEAEKRAAQMDEIVLKIADDVEVNGAYYAWYYSTAYNAEYNKLYQEAQAEMEANSAADSAAEPTMPEIKVDMEAIKATTKENIVATKMAYKKAVEAGIELTDADYTAINAQINQLKSSITQQGISYSDYLDFSYTNSEAVNQIVKEEYMGTLYYASLATENYVSAKHILVKYGEGEEHTQEEAKKLAEEIKAELDGGADFDKLMNEKSEDGRDEAGNLASPDGYTFTRGQMVPAFEAAAFALEEGKISDLVEVADQGYNGYHIIKKIPTSLSGIASALSQGADASIASIIEAEKASITADVAVEETDKLSYYDEIYK